MKPFAYTLLHASRVWLLIFGFSLLEAHGQTYIEQPIGYRDTTISYLESGISGGGAGTPFWVQANRFGTVPNANTSGTFRARLEHRQTLISAMHTEEFQWSAGIEAVANTHKSSRLILPQAYAGFRFKNWELMAGRKKQWVGLADSSLGTGSYAWSGNALPNFRLQIGTCGYVSVPFTSGWVSFNAFYSEGFMDRNRLVTSHLKLHQKALYFRIGKAASRLRLYGGFNHHVQWGGHSPFHTVNGKMPSGFQNYLHVISGKPGDASLVVNEFDNGNRVGNHLGTIDVAAELETYSMILFAYRQNIYEDGSLYALTNIADGLNGIRLRRKNSYGSNFEIQEVVAEFLFTKSQGGAEFDTKKSAVKRGALGRDNYFNNSQIRDGWSMNGRTIGTPFITPTSAMAWKWPKYADFFTSNNRVAVYHLGLRGRFLQKFQWSGKFSFSNNVGTYDAPLVKSVNQFSGMLGVSGSVKVFGGLDLSAVFGYDNGDLLASSWGGSLAIRKTLILF